MALDYIISHWKSLISIFRKEPGFPWGGVVFINSGWVAHSTLFDALLANLKDMLTFAFSFWYLQSSGLFQEEPDVHSGHRNRVRSNADVAWTGCRKHGGQHGVSESDCGVHSHWKPRNLQLGQEVKGAERHQIIWWTHVYRY